MQTVIVHRHWNYCGSVEDDLMIKVGTKANISRRQLQYALPNLYPKNWGAKTSRVVEFRLCRHCKWE